MPFTQAADGTRIHYEVAGPRGAEPLLCIQGLGTDLRGWTFQRFALGRRYRLILVDNRGVGGSDKPGGPYDLEVMAHDAVAVLDAEGIPAAHVMGASMGGVLAQILAVRHPDRVRSLVLACTACRHQTWRRELLEGWATLAAEQGMRALAGRALRWLVGPRHRRRFGLPFNVFAPFVLNLPASAFVSQVRAILDMPDDVRLELCNIAVPTLVIVGTQDILTPLADSEELCELIRGSELVVVSGAAHGLMFDRAGEFNAAVQSFLDSLTREPEALAG
jgi:3-oxoadipate enol-lactonase